MYSDCRELWPIHRNIPEQSHSMIERAEVVIYIVLTLMRYFATPSNASGLESEPAYCYIKERDGTVWLCLFQPGNIFYKINNP
jgi:hypothetical protein